MSILLEAMTPLPSEDTYISVDDRNKFRDLVFNKVKDNTISDDELYHLSPFMRVVGVADEQRWIDLWNSSTHFNKPAFMAACFYTKFGEEIFNQVSEKERIDYSVSWIRPMVVMAEFEDFPKQALAALYKCTATSHRSYLIETYEKYRNNSNLPVSIYKYCWSQEGFALPF